MQCDFFTVEGYLLNKFTLGNIELFFFWVLYGILPKFINVYFHE